MANELALPDAMQYETISQIASRIRVRNTAFQNYYMLGPGQQNTEQLDGDEGSVDIFDNVRDAAKAVAAGADYPQDAADPVGKFRYSCIRGALERRHLGSNLNKLRQIGGPASVRDKQGRMYLAKQMLNFQMKFGTLRELAVAGMFRGGFYLKPSGTELIPTWTSTSAIQINYQVPSGHTAQLNYKGAGNLIATRWDTATTKIVDDGLAILEASEEDSGVPATDWWWNSFTWKKCVHPNTQIQALAGTASVIWSRNEFDPATGLRDVVLIGMPEITHHIYDAGAVVDGTYTKYVPDNVVLMTPPPELGQQWLTMIEGSDVYGPIPPATEPVEVYGQLFYFQWDGTKSSAVVLQRGNDLFIPRLAVPKAVWIPTVIF